MGARCGLRGSGVVLWVGYEGDRGRDIDHVVDTYGDAIEMKAPLSTEKRTLADLVSDLAACALIEGAYPTSLSAALETKAAKQAVLDKIKLRETALRLIANGPPATMDNDGVAAWAAFVAQEGLSSMTSEQTYG